MEEVVREMGKPSPGRHGVHAERSKYPPGGRRTVREGAQSTHSSEEASNDRRAKGCRKVESKWKDKAKKDP